MNKLLAFEYSHWFFPSIIMGLFFLAVMIVCVWRLARKAPYALSNTEAGESSSILRLVSLACLVAFYFWFMGFIGELFPNTGFGFLIASIPCLWVFALFYAPDFSKRTLYIVSANALVAPLTVWFVLGQFMNLSLP